MTNIVRKTTRPPSAPRTKLLVVRQAAKSVRHRDQPDRTPMRLAIGVIVTIGVIGAVWLMGYLGFRLGFAPIVGVPELMGGPGGSLAIGTMMLIRIPAVILQAGMAEPELLNREGLVKVEIARHICRELVHQRHGVALRGEVRHFVAHRVFNC